MKDVRMRSGKENQVSGVLAAVMFLCCLFVFNAQAQEREYVSNTTVEEFTLWDSNADERIDRMEFDNEIGEVGLYEDWGNENNELTEDDFNTQMFNQWDVDEDGFLSSEEYDVANAGWEADYGDNFDLWDADDDDMLDEDEYLTGMNDAGIYSDWDADADGILDENEFNDGLYNTWDVNDDGFLDLNEYNNRNTWLGSANMYNDY